MDPNLFENDRTAQINWLTNLASDIASYNDGPPEIGPDDAADLVEHWISGVDMPTWFDDHDKSWLIDKVRQDLGR